ncbi:MAG: M20 family metallopeptidase [Geminicoccaceae bacterium]|nr:M20 family metallopeptidase [Geminicoccaceae bacterium]
MIDPARLDLWLAARERDMLALLERIVNIDSGSHDHAGVTAVAEAIAAFLEGEGVAVEWLPQERSGHILRARVAGPPGAPILLLGHCDTVFPKGEAARRPFRIEAARAFGPGVADMKGGLVMNAFVLAAFARLGGAPCPLLGLFTSDEEIGSPVSRPIIEATAQGCRAVFNAEPGRPSGNVCNARNGGIFARLRIEGRAAHAGSAWAEGRSAILELAHKTIALAQLSAPDAGITVNVGVVRGGQSVNTVAPWAEAEVDLRYRRLADRDRLLSAVHAIVARASVPETRAEFAIEGEFLPLEPTPASDRLLAIYREAAKAAGFAVAAEFSGGCADSGFTAALGVPTLCSLGPVGGKSHTPEEYVEVGTLLPRARALARTILLLAPQ